MIDYKYVLSKCLVEAAERSSFAKVDVSSSSSLTIAFAIYDITYIYIYIFFFRSLLSNANTHVRYCIAPVFLSLSCYYITYVYILFIILFACLLRV